MLTKIKLFLKNYWIFALLAFLVIVVASIALSKKTPPVEVKHDLLKYPLFKKANIKEENISYGSLIKNEPSSFQELPVFLARPKEKFDYSILLKKDQPVSSVNNNTDCLTVVTSFLKENGRFKEEIEKGKVTYKYYKGDYEVIPAYSFTDADIVAVNLSPNISSLSVVQNSPFHGLIQAWVDKQGMITKITEILAQYDLGEAKFWPIISYKEAFKQLEQQKGVVTAIAQHEDLYNPPTTSINKIVITQAYLAYFQEENLPSPLQPIWIFEGETMLEDGSYSSVAIYLPAVREDYLTPAP